MRLLISALAAPLLLAITASAQTILVYGSDALPTCAQSCTLLQQAQSACVPPAAPVTNQATYESCFCQSGYISSLKTTSSGVCDSECSTSDQQLIQTWYTSNCKDDGADVAAADTTTTAATTNAQATAASTVAGTTAVATSSATSTALANHHESWWDKHWKWVVMLIVLAIGFTALAVVGSLLKRHYDRKRDEMKGTFNSGITHRSAPMTATAGPALYNYDGPAEGGHVSPEASAAYVPGVREKDFAVTNQRSMSSMRGSSNVDNRGAPVEEMEMASRGPKGKARMPIDD